MISKKIKLLILPIIVGIVLVISVSFIQSEKKIASANVKSLDGKIFNTGTISNKRKPIIICVWETNCKPCIHQLDNISEVYEQWQKETGVKLIAISIDDSRTIANVSKTVKSKGWEYAVYTDVNQDFKRAMSIDFCPYTYLVDGNGSIIWEKGSYSEGDEDKLYELLKKTAN